MQQRQNVPHITTENKKKTRHQYQQHTKHEGPTRPPTTKQPLAHLAVNERLKATHSTVLVEGEHVLGLDGRRRVVAVLLENHNLTHQVNKLAAHVYGAEGQTHVLAVDGDNEAGGLGGRRR